MFWQVDRKILAHKGKYSVISKILHIATSHEYFQIFITYEDEGELLSALSFETVSYTHLDVYKRQLDVTL